MKKIICSYATNFNDPVQQPNKKEIENDKTKHNIVTKEPNQNIIIEEELQMENNIVTVKKLEEFNAPKYIIEEFKSLGVESMTADEYGLSDKSIYHNYIIRKFNLKYTTFYKLVTNNSFEIRLSVAWNPNTPIELLEKLSKDDRAVVSMVAVKTISKLQNKENDCQSTTNIKQDKSVKPTSFNDLCDYADKVKNTVKIKQSDTHKKVNLHGETLNEHLTISHDKVEPEIFESKIQSNIPNKYLLKLNDEKIIILHDGENVCIEKLTNNKKLKIFNSVESVKQILKDEEGLNTSINVNILTEQTINLIQKKESLTQQMITHEKSYKQFVENPSDTHPAVLYENAQKELDIISKKIRTNNQKVEKLLEIDKRLELIEKEFKNNNNLFIAYDKHKTKTYPNTTEGQLQCLYDYEYDKSTFSRIQFSNLNKILEELKDKTNDKFKQLVEMIETKELETNNPQIIELMNKINYGEDITQCSLWLFWQTEYQPDQMKRYELLRIFETWNSEYRNVICRVLSSYLWHRQEITEMLYNGDDIERNEMGQQND